MKTSFLRTTVSTFITFSFLFILSFSSAHATVGGPTYVGYPSYNPANESVYFIEASSNGRGCPPELKKISLNTEKTDIVFSCTQGENLTGDIVNGQTPVMAEIAKLTTGFKDLTPISLPKNSIQIDIRFIESKPIEPGSDWIIQSNFTATVYQDGKKIDEFPIAGCNTEQPFTFAGYAIPGFEKKIILLSSTKGDCFEGGYTIERMHVTGGITSLDRTYTSNQFKTTDFPLVPSENTLIVFEKDTIVTKPISDPTEIPDTKRNSTTIVLVVILALVVGLLLGRFFKKTTKLSK